ncbi:MAG: hypothetical protein AAF196_20500 [Planctomycetota bacterium]
MPLEYDIRPYQPGDEAGILPSFNTVFREVVGEGFEDRAPELWDWQYLQNPAGHRIWLAVTPDGTIAGQYAGVPQTFATDFGKQIFVHAVDSFVVKEHRAGLKRPGLFVNTGQPWFQWCEDGGDGVIYGYPVPNARRIGEKFLGYQMTRSVDYLVRPFEVGEIQRETSDAELTVRTVDEVPQDLDQLNERFLAGRRCAMNKTRDVVDWRYRQVPDGRSTYTLIEARRGAELHGFAVLRVNWELVPDACWIADWMTAEGDGEARLAMLQLTAELGQAAGRTSMAAMFAPWSPESKHFERLGFAWQPSSNWFERIQIVNPFHAEMPVDWLRDHWWYTLGDTDLV